MPKKIYPNEMRRWLELYDAGASETSIAKDAHRDVRTVKKCIARARREREMLGARVELLKTVLKQHQDRLLNTVKELESAFVMPATGLWMVWKQDASLPQLSFTGANATYEEFKGWTVKLPAENKLEWGLVQEHLKGDPVWANLTVWKKAFASHIAARVALETTCANLLMAKTGYRLIDKDGKPPFVYSYTTLNIICSTVLNRALGIEQKMEFEDMVFVDKGEVKSFRGVILAEVPGEEEMCRLKIIESHNELLKSKEATRAGHTYRELAETTKKARRSVEEILLLEMIPADCRVCRRLGK